MRIKIRNAVLFITACATLFAIYVLKRSFEVDVGDESGSSALQRDSARKLHKQKLIEMHLWPFSNKGAIEHNYQYQCQFARKTPAKTDITVPLWDKFDFTESDDADFMDLNETHWSLKKRIKVIVIPHSHVDPAWGQTFENYYQSQVSAILQNIITKMYQYTKMKFIWSDIIYIDHWWRLASNQERKKFLDLVKSGRIEIVSGGFTVPDDATTHIYSLVENLVLGHEWVQSNLKVKPTAAWPADLFGLSATSSFLYNRANLTKSSAVRIDFRHKTHFRRNQLMQFYWRQAWSDDANTDVLTHIHYGRFYTTDRTCGPADGICGLFDFRPEADVARAEPVTQDNVKRLARLLYKQYRQKAQAFRHGVLLHLLGKDFRWDRDWEWDYQYLNYSLLMDYVNTQKEMNFEMKFGTYSDFFAEVEATQVKLPTLKGDFFPYSDQVNDFWTGFYTSRPWLKLQGRILQYILRGAEILISYVMTFAKQKDETSYLGIFSSLNDILNSARVNLTFFHHHDGVTGTSTEEVMFRYSILLRENILELHKLIQLAIRHLLEIPMNKTDTFFTASYSAPSQFVISPDFFRSHPMAIHNHNLIFFNPSSQTRYEVVRLPISSSQPITVRDTKGRIIPSQLNPTWKNATFPNPELYELIFVAHLPPLSLTVFQTQTSSGENPSHTTASIRHIGPSASRIKIQGSPFSEKTENPTPRFVVLENLLYRYEFDSVTGMLYQAIDTTNNARTLINLQFLIYESRGSGAYLFFPTGRAVPRVSVSAPIVQLIEGPIMSEVHVQLSSTIALVYRACRKVDLKCGIGLEIEVLIDWSDCCQQNELIMRIRSDIANQGYVYTDSNGAQMIRRLFNPNLHIGGNYYPVTTNAYIQDRLRRLSIAVSQAAGVASLQPGWLEVMLERRPMYDDNRGLGQGIADNQVFPQRLVLLLESRDPVEQKASINPLLSFPSLVGHALSDRLLYPVTALSTVSTPSQKIFRLAAEALPCDVSLLGLRTRPDVTFPSSRVEFNGELILHLHSLGFECGFPTSGLACTTGGGFVDLKALFGNVVVKTVTRMSLSLLHAVGKPSYSFSHIPVSPMELYTFIVNV